MANLESMLDNADQKMREALLLSQKHKRDIGEMRKEAALVAQQRATLRDKVKKLQVRFERTPPRPPRPAPAPVPLCGTGRERP